MKDANVIRTMEKYYANDASTCYRAFVNVRFQSVIT